MASEYRKDLPILPFRSQEAWDKWLASNFETSQGLWLKIAKKGTGIDSVTYGEALDTALCYGWIDSQKGSYDEEYWLQRFTRRRPRSKWSKRNRERVTALIDQDRMKPAGLREVERAKKDGRWEAAYDSPATATVPEDLKQKFAENPAAEASFAGLDSRNRFAILSRIQDAKKPETRTRRIDQLVAMLNEGKKLY